MIEKIDPGLLNKITAENKNNSVDCVIYTNNFYLTKKYLQRYISEIVSYPFISAFGVKLKSNNIINIAKLKTVNYITASAHVSAFMNVAHKVINLEKKAEYNKNKITVAVIDTGVSPILDLCVPENKITVFKDFVNNKENPYDDNGHGTQVTATLCGNGLISGGKYAGINGNVRVACLKALDKNGETGALTILKAMQWVYDNRQKYNIKVVCMSFGSIVTGANDPLIVGAEVLWNSGITVVCAAGNSGPEKETIKSPGASKKIIAVGALNDNRNNEDFIKEKFEVADFSSRGPVLGGYKPDLLAPGVNIISACRFCQTKKSYSTMSGTSVATPIVAGVCTRLLERSPNLTPNQIKTILLTNCEKLLNDFNAEGHGLLNCNNIF